MDHRPGAGSFGRESLLGSSRCSCLEEPSEQPPENLESQKHDRGLEHGTSTDCEPDHDRARLRQEQRGKVSEPGPAKQFHAQVRPWKRRHRRSCQTDEQEAECRRPCRDPQSLNFRTMLARPGRALTRRSWCRRHRSPARLSGDGIRQQPTILRETETRRRQTPAM